MLPFPELDIGERPVALKACSSNGMDGWVVDVLVPSSAPQRLCPSLLRDEVSSQQ